MFIFSESEVTGFPRLVELGILNRVAELGILRKKSPPMGAPDQHTSQADVDHKCVLGTERAGGTGSRENEVFPKYQS